MVKVEYAQIAGSVKAARDKGQKRWDLGNLANTKSNRYRLMLGELILLRLVIERHKDWMRMRLITRSIGHGAFLANEWRRSNQLCESAQCSMMIG